MRLQVKPTRMELLALKKRIVLARRGHALLKDKEEQLLIEFRALVSSARARRAAIERSAAAFYITALSVRGRYSGPEWEESLARSGGTTSVEARVVRAFNIPVTRLSLAPNETEAMTCLPTDPALISLFRDARQFMENLVALADLEARLAAFSREIERTRRRVNALEYVLLPSIAETIRFISLKMAETERSGLVRLKHVRSVKQRG